MQLRELTDYTSHLSNLTKFEVKTELDEFGALVVTETKETFVYEDEESADEKINSSVANPLCSGHSKKYKAGKMNKAGDVVKPETWTVVIKLNH